MLIMKKHCLVQLRCQPLAVPCVHRLPLRLSPTLRHSCVSTRPNSSWRSIHQSSFTQLLDHLLTVASVEARVAKAFCMRSYCTTQDRQYGGMYTAIHLYDMETRSAETLSDHPLIIVMIFPDSNW